MNVHKPSVHLSAYTGMAAKGIQGTTLHSLLGPNLGTSLHAVRKNSTCTLNTYRCSLSQLKILKIDEIFFVGSNFLKCIQEP